MTRHIRRLALCWLALSACTTEYALVNDGNSRPDGGDEPSGDGDGDGDGDNGPGGSGGGSGNPGTDSGVVPGGGNAICTRDGLCRQLPVTNTDKVDVLFMVDNTFSMEQEQASLRAQFPRFINVLSSGDRNGDGVRDFAPAKDLHFGVVTSDLGLPGLDGSSMPIPNCMGLGDQGRLINESNPELAADGLCSSAAFNPPFVTFQSNIDDPAQAANDFACLATVGLDGCGFEQQLESMLKAVWPGSDQNVTFVTDTNGFGMFGMAGPGFPNGELIRNNPNEGPSLISLVMVTDEDDCSSHRMDHFVPSASPNGLNTRCHFEGLRGAESNLFQVQRYIDLFKMLRPDEDHVLFDAIVGVPPVLVHKDVMSELDFDDDAERDAYYASVLDHPDMQERIDDKGTPEVLDDDGLVPSCYRGEDAKAYPPRRIVQVAQGLGANGMIHSICQDDFTEPFLAIIDRISKKLGDHCLSAPLEREGDRVACDVYWELPSAPVGNSPTDCEDLDFLTEVAALSSAGRKLCKVNQLAVVNGEPISGGDGFYYDDFSEDVQQECNTSSTKTRIAFTPSAQPPTGVNVYLNCD